MTAAVLGVIFHISIQGIEFERHMYTFLAALPISFVAFTYTFQTTEAIHLGEASAQAAIILTIFLLALLTSMSIYRLFFHRLHSFPGPHFSRLSRIYAAYLAAKNMQFYRELAALHFKHGDFVRTGPRELSIMRPSAIPLIFGPNTRCRKTTWHSQTNSNGDKCAMTMTRDPVQHRLRRRAWDRGFSMRALGMYEPRVKEKVDMFVRKLSEMAGDPVDVTEWSMFLAFDIMGEVGFGKDFGNLASGAAHPGIQAIHKHMNMMGILSMMPWLLNILGSIPGAAKGFASFFDFCGTQMEEKARGWDPQKEPGDIASWLVKAVMEKDVSAPPTKEALDDDSRILIIAGSDTTAATLTFALYFLCKHPAKQQKLQQLLDDAISDQKLWTYETIKSVSYIDDIINETLRLCPPLANSSPRETPAQGIVIDDVYIPGGINVIIPVRQIQRDPRYWTKAEDFVPERWGEQRQDMKTDDAPWLPFLLGAHSCVGKNLAYLSLRTSLSLIMLNFDVGLALEESGRDFINGALDTVVLMLPPLRLVFTPRAPGTTAV
ncbi:cytochrome P450 [Polyplosphaeria fusca]|uniref:Cytochrome P450 n=1 Tax=Polyplosphaeria fusca TaxID=682080 RepID=A0A9P4UXN0_9PLEO|nr:cytochrome P450 [Polyplosphaeria fusca]